MNLCLATYEWMLSLLLAKCAYSLWVYGTFIATRKRFSQIVLGEMLLFTTHCIVLIDLCRKLVVHSASKASDKVH